VTTTLDAALARLRNADPAAVTPADDPATNPRAQRMLTQILQSAGGNSPARPGRARPRLRRVVLAGAVVAALAATAVASVVPMPWSHGRAPAAAYAVTKHADGTVGVTIHWNQLRDPDGLNAQLRQAGVRAAVMLYAAPGRCRTPVTLDRAYSTGRLDLRRHPELQHNPTALTAYLKSQTPWISQPAQPGDRDNVAVFTIHPDAIPRGDQLLILPQWTPTKSARANGPVGFRALIVRELPRCVPSPTDSITTSNAIRAR
jgi:hypothetical protein